MGNGLLSGIQLASHTFFEGTFDGQGHTISGLYCNYQYFEGSKVRDDVQYRNIALFGYVSDATIENLIIKDSCFIGNGAWTVAAIAGRECGVIKNCTNYAYIYGEGCIDGVGGLPAMLFVVM